MGEAIVEEKRLEAVGVDPTMALARDAAAGDSVATGKLLRALAPRLLRVVRAVLGGAHPDLDDAVQQTLIAFVQALPRFRGEGDPLGYASVIAVRTAVAVRKRASSENARRDDDAEADLLAGHSPSPADEAAAQRRKEILRDLLAQLPAEQGEALAMSIVLGWSHDEIAERSGAPVNTVRSRLRLAKQALKKRIEGSEGLVEALGVAR